MKSSKKFLYLFAGYSLVVFPLILTLGVLLTDFSIQVNLGVFGKLVGRQYLPAFEVYIIPTLLLTYFGYKLQVEGRKMT